MPRTDYGLDAPRLVRRLAIRGGLLVAFGLVLYVVNRTTSPAAAKMLGSLAAGIGVALVFASLVMIWSSRVGKLKMRDRMLDSFSWRGDENVLDVGCGRGLLLIGAAKRLKTGKATGVDIWRVEDLSGNRAEAALANAKEEGVAGRVRIENADARKLPFGANSFDIVLSSLAIHSLAGSQERAKALREMVRVLKPGGRLAIFDIAFAGEYARLFRELGLHDVQLSGLGFLWCLPTRTASAQKP